MLSACLAPIRRPNEQYHYLHINIEDVRTTEQLRKAGELLDIELLDHIVIGHSRFVSLKERGLGF